MVIRISFTIVNSFIPHDCVIAVIQSCFISIYLVNNNRFCIVDLFPM